MAEHWLVGSRFRRPRTVALEVPFFIQARREPCLGATELLTHVRPAGASVLSLRPQIRWKEIQSRRDTTIGVGYREALGTPLSRR